MSTPPNTLPTTPLIPLSPELQAAYEALNAKYEAELEITRDPGVSEALNAAQTDVDNILTKNALYLKSQDTNLFAALKQQIDSTNAGLQSLKDQIASVASHISTAGEIIGAIDKVLSLLPGA
jgi:flagellar biosynthesis/type III secretory pathway protein FliH